MATIHSREAVAVTNLRVGDMVEFYGAIFEIVDTGESRGHIDGHEAYGRFDDFVGPSPVAVPKGRFVSGAPVTGYFGPDRDWTFQGNQLAKTCRVTN